MKRRAFITLLEARRRSGRLQRWHSKAKPRAASGYFRPDLRMIRIQTLHWSVPAGVGAAGLEHRPQRADRDALGHQPGRRNSQTRGGVGRARARCHPGPWCFDHRTVVAGDPYHPRGIPDGQRPGRRRLRRKPRATGWYATGFMVSEYGIAAKWLELLKEIAPKVTRVAVLRDAAVPTGPAQFGVIQVAAPSLRMVVSPVSVRDAPGIERAIAAFAPTGNGGLIVMGER